MKIKKTFQGTLPEYKILNEESDSKIDTYSCDYINNLGGGGSSSEEFSTTETVIGTWTNGKPVYRKVVTKALNGSTPVDLTTGNVEQYIKIDGNLKRSNGVTNAIPIMTTDSNWLLNFGDSTASYIRVALGSMMKSQSGTITLVVEYTKSTD